MIYLKAFFAAALVLVAFYFLYLNQTSEGIYRHQVIDQLETQGFRNFTMKDHLRGGEFQLTQLLGKTVLLNFWATWCEPCAKEIPDMVALVEHFKGEIALVAVSADEDVDELNAFIKAFGGLSADNVYILRDPERKISEKYGVELLPETFIFQRDGKLSRKIVGFIDWYNDDSIAFMQKLIYPEPESEPETEPETKPESKQKTSN